jgi:putative endonuclease
MPKKQTHKFGLYAEKFAIFFLSLKGYQILEWRYKTPLGEVDIIAKKSRVIIAIEVKARKSKFTVSEVLHRRQIERVKRATEIFIAKNPQFHNHDLRFDFIEVTGIFRLKHHRNFIS